MVVVYSIFREEGIKNLCATACDGNMFALSGCASFLNFKEAREGDRKANELEGEIKYLQADPDYKPLTGLEISSM